MVLHLERKFTSPTETFIANQINALDTLEHVVFTIEHLDYLNANATIVHPSKLSAFSTKILKSAHKKFFTAELQKFRPQIIHGHYITDSVFFHPITKHMKTPKICSCYGYDVSVIPKKFGVLAKYYFEKVFKEYDLFLAMTNEMKKDLLEIGCPENKIKVHYHGINTKQFEVERDYNLKDGVLNLLTIASLYPVKGHKSVLKALKIFKENNPESNLKYTIIGNGLSKFQLEAFVSQSALDDIVEFRPAIKHGSEFNRALKEAGVFLHPSITTRENDKEGIPGAIVEAMASGLPVIATYHGGIPYILEQNKTGFLVKEHDAFAISKYIELLYDNKDLRIRIGENAKKYAHENLDLFQKAMDLEEIYNSLINK